MEQTLDTIKKNHLRKSTLNKQFHQNKAKYIFRKTVDATKTKLT